jgi:hypothetical protein
VKRRREEEKSTQQQQQNGRTVRTRSEREHTYVLKQPENQNNIGRKQGGREERKNEKGMDFTRDGDPSISFLLEFLTFDV